MASHARTSKTHDVSLPPELAQLERLIAVAGDCIDVEVACKAPCRGRDLPVYVIGLGSRSLSVPAVGMFGGVHGLERIGARVVIAHLHNLVMRLRWDVALAGLLERVRLVFMPIVNPAGMADGTRANAQGVDLMRNAPVDASDQAAPLVGGQRISAALPWYRGRRDAPMQPESAALCAVVERELHSRPFSIALDCHSGFGMRDRLWFPYAYRRTPVEHLAELHALHAIFSESYAHHPYVFEPQSRQYIAHGDLWDHLVLRAQARGQGMFLPLTLEMGSWLWVRKNPRQVFTRAGIFNPLIAHREQRVLRRHIPLLDFVMHAAAGWQHWVPHGEERELHHRAAIRKWYW